MMPFFHAPTTFSGWLALSLLAASMPLFAADPHTNIFDPDHAPEIVIKVKVPKKRPIPITAPSETLITSRNIENHPAATHFNQVITATVPGTTPLASGEMRIRGSDSQFSYYLDGAPLPPAVSGSFGDQLDPKTIESLRVFTGDFPAEYGGQLAAIFDVTAKAGEESGGTIEQLISGYSTNDTRGQYSGGDKRFSYFLSGTHSDSHVRLSPVTQTPLHDAGAESNGFLKMDYQSGAQDRITVHLGAQSARTQIPNTPDREAVGQDDVQRENGLFGDLIWRHTQGTGAFRLALYARQARLRFDGSPQDLVPSPDDGTDASGLISTYQDQSLGTLGLRGVQTSQASAHDHVTFGFDLSRFQGTQKFRLLSAPQTGDAPIVDERPITGDDAGFFAQDDWTARRLFVNYGVRYDIHRDQITSTQMSPRLNLRYTASPRDQFHAFYNHLFQPIAPEDVKNLVGKSSIGDSSQLIPLKPERNDFFGIGWSHREKGTRFALDAYYKSSKDVADSETLGSTQITVPVNEAKGYVRGIELSFTRTFSPSLTGYANYARSWGKAAGPIVGGLLGGSGPDGYFSDDHDQTHTATFGLSYENRGTFVTGDGEYGSGLPYGEIDDADGNPVSINYLRVAPHLIFNFSAGTSLGKNSEIAVTVENFFNHAYVIHQSSPFTDVEWAQGRTVGLRGTFHF